MNWQLFKRPAIGLAAAVLFGVSAQAAPLTGTFVVDVAGISSNDAQSSAINEKRSIYISPNATLTGLSIDAELFADAPSWLSEMAIRFSASNGDFFDYAPSLTNAAGSEAVSDSLADLSAALGADFNIGMDGWLTLEFFELNDDFADSFDGLWNFGSLRISASGLPEPASLVLAGLALAGMGAASRRRQQRQA